jgi:serine/threonine protein kinase
VQDALGATFVLERELKGGTMSRVFVGSETALGRQVVIKMLVPEARDTAHEAEFRREAMLAARLQHPHIIPVFTVGTVAGVPYYTMPFIDGESLRERLDRAGAMPVGEAVRVLREIGGALAFAHGLGVIHRDVKPENIVLDRGSGRALLADFGIAFMAGESTRVPTPGTTVGTPAYMSPEQVDGLELDGRTDTYSLGLVAWEMLTGSRPWSGESVYDIMYRQKNQSLPTFAACGVDVPASVEAAVERATRKQRDERWLTVADMMLAIDPPVRQTQHAGVWPRAERTLGTAADHAKLPPREIGDDVAARDRGDPAAAATIAMDVWRGVGWSSHRISVNGESTRSGRDADGRDSLRRRIRWAAAACGATAITAGLVAAGTLGHNVVKWSIASGQVNVDAPGLSEIPRIDTVPMHLALGGLAPLPSDTLPSAAPVLLAAASAPALSVRAPTTVPRPATRSSSRLSQRDALRARAATATLALQAYEHAKSGESWHIGWTPTPSVDSVTPAVAPPASDVTSTTTDPASVPAAAVRVPARRPGSARSLTPASGVADSVLPAVGVRVPARPHVSALQQR